MKWWQEPELNRRHKDFQSSALPTELSCRNQTQRQISRRRQMETVSEVPNLRQLVVAGIYYARGTAKGKPVRTSIETADLTHIKCYRSWAVDEGFIDALTHIHGYRSPEHEFDLQTRVSRQDPRPLSTRQIGRA